MLKALPASSSPWFRILNHGTPASLTTVAMVLGVYARAVDRIPMKPGEVKPAISLSDVRQSMLLCFYLPAFRPCGSKLSDMTGFPAYGH